MSCAPRQPLFRLLDRWVGWDIESAQGLIGFDDDRGVRLKPEGLAGIPPEELFPWLPPLPLARTCDPCVWLLATPYPPQSRLMKLSPCACVWEPLWPDSQNILIDAVAVAVWRKRIAVADQGAHSVRIWARAGAQLAGEIALAEPGSIAFTPDGELLVVDLRSGRILRFSPSGDPCGSLDLQLPQGKPGPMAVGKDCALWLITTFEGASFLWRAEFTDSSFTEHHDTAAMHEVFDRTALSYVSPAGLCIGDTCCTDWYGRTVDPSKLPSPAATKLLEQGQLLTTDIDSGIPRCRWHRVRIDADIPPGTSVAVAVATNEEANAAPQGDATADPDWSVFDAGVPHPLDWHTGLAGASDFLVDQPPGRYMRLRLRLTGDGTTSPAVFRIRLDLPRTTSLDWLPGVYRETPETEDFLERFLSAFDAQIEELDRSIIRAEALLDTQGVPGELLPWLGKFLDVIFEADWPPAQRRRILAALPGLYRRRGTVAGMQQAIEIVFGAEAVVQELPFERTWGAAGQARLGDVRLFGRSRARFRVGTSPLSRTPLRSYGSVDLDPFTQHAFRFRVLTPPIGEYGPIDSARLRQLVESQKPAHTIAATARTGGAFILGGELSLGLDTRLWPLPAPVLGSNTILRATTIIWPRETGPWNGLQIGEAVAVGLPMALE